MHRSRPARQCRDRLSQTTPTRPGNPPSAKAGGNHHDEHQGDRGRFVGIVDDRAWLDSALLEGGLHSLMALMLDELRELRDQNRRMKHQVEKIARRRVKLEHRMDAVQRNQKRQLKRLTREHQLLALQLDALNAPTKIRCSDIGHLVPAWPPTVPPSQANHFPLSLLQAVPQLADYDFKAQRCIVEDLGQMMLVLPTNGACLFEDVVPPIISYATPSMCSLLGYPPGGLSGRDMSAIGSLSEDGLATIFAAMMRRSSAAVGKPMEVETAMLTLAGGTVYSLTQQQVLYGPSGAAQWSLVVVKEVHQPPEHPRPFKPTTDVLRDPKARRSLRCAVEALLLHQAQSPEPRSRS